MPTIYTKILEAARAIGGTVAKDASNPHFKNRYASLLSVIQATGPHLADAGLILEEWTEVDDDGRAIAACRLVDAETGEAGLACRFPLSPTKKDPQGMASAHTYARRYLRMAVCGLAPVDDDGNEASAQWSDPEQRKEEEAAEALKRQARELYTQLSRLDRDRAGKIHAQHKDDMEALTEALSAALTDVADAHNQDMHAGADQ